MGEERRRGKRGCAAGSRCLTDIRTPIGCMTLPLPQLRKLYIFQSYQFTSNHTFLTTLLVIARMQVL